MGPGPCWWGEGAVLKLFNPGSTTLGLQKKQHPEFPVALAHSNGLLMFLQRIMCGVKAPAREGIPRLRAGYLGTALARGLFTS